MSSVGPLQTGHVEKLGKLARKTSFIWRGRSSCLYGTSSILQKRGVGVRVCFPEIRFPWVQLSGSTFRGCFADMKRDARWGVL